jgi:hypothetical protein
MGLKANWIETYKNKEGKNIFVYLVSGPIPEIETYKKIQGKFYRQTLDGRPKFYSPFYYGKSGSLTLTNKKNKYFIKNDQLTINESIVERFGGDLYLELARKTGDINWIFHVENIKLSNKLKYEKHYKKNEEEYNKLKTQYLTSLNASLSPVIKKQSNQYFEEGLKHDKGFTFLNEWHFAADVIKKLEKDEIVIYNIVEQVSNEEEEDFAGILSNEQGNKYDITKDENIWMFKELRLIFNLEIIPDYQNKTLKLGRHLKPED